MSHPEKGRPVKTHQVLECVPGKGLGSGSAADHGSKSFEITFVHVLSFALSGPSREGSWSPGPMDISGIIRYNAIQDECHHADFFIFFG